MRVEKMYYDYYQIIAIAKLGNITVQWTAKIVDRVQNEENI